jgi:hypothetical protein
MARPGERRCRPTSWRRLSDHRSWVSLAILETPGWQRAAVRLEAPFDNRSAEPLAALPVAAGHGDRVVPQGSGKLRDNAFEAEPRGGLRRRWEGRASVIFDPRRSL